MHAHNTYCLNTTKTDYLARTQIPHCPQLTGIDALKGRLCHDWLVGTFRIEEQIRGYREAKLVVSSWDLGKDKMKWVRINKNVYNVTQYINGLRNSKTQTIDKDHSHPNAYLYKQLHLLIFYSLGPNATELYNELFDTDKYLE